MTKVKERIYEILEATQPADRVSRSVQGFIIVLIVLNVGAVVFATVDSIYQPYQRYFQAFELFSVIVFTIEYLLRVWVCTEDPEYNRPLVGRLRFMVTPGALIDLLAILPFYLPKTGVFDFRTLRALRLFRLFRLLKLGRYSASVTELRNVLDDKKEQVFLALMAVLVLLILASSAMYYAERDAQPDHFSHIPDAMWWGVVTMTTVGYGDVTPITTLGKVLGGFISLLGIGLFALPAGILASGFEEALKRKAGDEEEEEDDESTGKQQEDGEVGEKKYCPCCGRRLEEEESEEAQ